MVNKSRLHDNISVLNVDNMNLGEQFGETRKCLKLYRSVPILSRSVGYYR